MHDRIDAAGFVDDGLQGVLYIRPASAVHAQRRDFDAATDGLRAQVLLLTHRGCGPVDAKVAGRQEQGRC